MESSTYSWRNLITRIPSERRSSSDTSSSNYNQSNSNNNMGRRRRRPQSRHQSLDTSLNDTNTATAAAAATTAPSSSHSKPPPTPPKAMLTKTHSKSLLQRFLQSTSRRLSQNHSTSGEGSTVSRMTEDSADLLNQNQNNGLAESSSSPSRRRTMDVMDATTKSEKSTGSIPSRTNASSPRALLRAGQHTFRRATLDLGLSSHHKRTSSRDSSFDDDNDGNDYASTQTSLQRQADDLHKGGQLEAAIDVWVECLTLAEEHHDTLTTKTEFMCILVDLHLQVSLQHEHLHLVDEDGDNARRPHPDIVERGTRYHKQAAKRYVHRIKPILVKPQWFSSCSKKPLIELFCHAEAWELAIAVADQLLQEQQSLGGGGSTNVVDPQQLATMHFHVASQKLDTQRQQGEALQHLQATVRHLQQVPVETRDMTMYLQVLQLLATEYASQSQYGVALEAYQEQLQHAPKEKHASLYCQMAQVYISTQQLDKALEPLDAAASLLEEESRSATDSSTIRLQLLQTKGDVYCRLGRMEESYQVYQQALQEAAANVNPAEQAKLLYTLGRLCVRLKRIRPAITYFTKEMEITKAELGQNHLSVSRVLHELAKLYDEYLGEHKMALMKLNKALQIELAVLQECHYAIAQTCNKCNPVTHRMCCMHGNLQRDVSAQIRDTKKAKGRLHFKLGDFEQALKTSFQKYEN